MFEGVAIPGRKIPIEDLRARLPSEARFRAIARRLLFHGLDDRPNGLVCQLMPYRYRIEPYFDFDQPPRRRGDTVDWTICQGPWEIPANAMLVSLGSWHGVYLGIPDVGLVERILPTFAAACSVFDVLRYFQPLTDARLFQMGFQRINTTIPVVESGAFHGR